MPANLNVTIRVTALGEIERFEPEPDTTNRTQSVRLSGKPMGYRTGASWWTWGAQSRCVRSSRPLPPQPTPWLWVGGVECEPEARPHAKGSLEIAREARRQCPIDQKSSIYFEL